MASSPEEPPVVGGEPTSSGPAAPEPAAAAPAVEAARPVEEGGDAYHTRIVIRPGGEVLIENLSMDLIELAELLDPDAKIACEAPEPLPE
jgi:hypothetical protein